MTEEYKIRVFVADRQPLFRWGVANALAKVEGMLICGEDDLGPQLLAEVEASEASVILLDIDYPSFSGLKIAAGLKQLLPTLSVVIISPEENDDVVFQAIKARAAAFINRNVAGDELVAVIRSVSEGKYPINDNFVSRPQVAERILNQFHAVAREKDTESLLSPLTNRETEVLNLMAKGQLNKQIASSLNVSEQTVKNHVTSILRKLDANVRTEAVVIAFKHGLISLEKNS